MRQLVHKTYYTIYHVPLYFWWAKLAWKHRKSHKYCLIDYLKTFYLHFAPLTMIQVSGNTPILAKHRKIHKKAPQSSVKILLVSIFDLKQTYKIMPTENCWIRNFPATRFIQMSIKSLTKPSKLLKTQQPPEVLCNQRCS